MVFGSTSIVIGILWDISWHRTIGRDSFWTPAHMAIYLGGLIGGLVAGGLILQTTLSRRAADRAQSVGLWGLRGPLGAWVAVWGALAMAASAPFDDWWHNAYGLDVKILSPPHSVLALGMWAVVLGAILLVLREQNHADRDQAAPGRWLFVYAAGVLLAMAAVFVIEESFPNQQHSAKFYLISCTTYPLYLVGISRASRLRFGATCIALVYMLITAGMAWILPLFSGEPKLGPIYHRVDHFVPLPFPLLLVVPALAIDLMRLATNRIPAPWGSLALVLGSGLAFTAFFVFTQWHFSSFLLSGQADNWFFAADRHWGYTEQLGEWRRRFWIGGGRRQTVPFSTSHFLLCWFIATVSSAAGLWLGWGMSRVRR
jgi:hypothetical protein